MPLEPGQNPLSENPSDTFEEDILQLETNTPALGGPDGIMNDQAKVLGGRTRFLLALVQALQSDTYTQTQVNQLIDQAINNLIDSAPGALDTLNELAAALGDDPNFAATLNSSIAARLAAANNLSDVQSVAAARSNLNVYSQSETASQIAAGINNLINSAPGALDTLNELAAALGDDPNFATTINNALALRLTQTQADERYIQRIIEIEDNNPVTVIGSTSSDGVSSSNVLSFTVDYSAMPDGLNIFFHEFVFMLDISCTVGASFRSGQSPRMSMYANDVLVQTIDFGGMGGIRTLVFEPSNKFISKPSGPVTYRFTFAAMLTGGGWSYVRRGGLKFFAEGGKLS